MKSLLLMLPVAIIFWASCNKADITDRCTRVNVIAPDSEVVKLQAYITSKSIPAIADPRGFFYIITRQSSDTARPTVCSKIIVSYTGRLTNGLQFDAANGQSFYLSGLVTGWQEGIPLIGKGGFITLYLPPSLAYGSAPQTNIPANSILVFQIELVDVQ